MSFGDDTVSEWQSISTSDSYWMHNPCGACMSIFDKDRHICPNEQCKGCDRVATGFATINDDRYCHGDDDETPTCYERAQAGFCDDR